MLKKYFNVLWIGLWLVGGCCLSLLNQNVFAEPLFPNEIWQSGIISVPLRAAVAGDEGLDRQWDLVGLGTDRLLIWKNSDFSKPFIELKWKRAENPVRLDVVDSNHDGILEIFVVIEKRERFKTYVYFWQGAQLTLKQTLSGAYTFWDGTRHWLGAQTQATIFPLPQSLKSFLWDGQKLVVATGDVKRPQLGPSRWDILGMTVGDNGYLCAQNDGTLAWLDAFGKILYRSGMRLTAPLLTVGESKSKDPLGIERSRLREIFPRFLWHSASRSIFISKNQGYLPRGMGAFSGIRQGEFIHLVWDGQTFAERNRRTVDGAIVDFSWMDFDGDGQAHEILLTLVTGEGGIAKTKPGQTRFFILQPFPKTVMPLSLTDNR